ncbi:MAG: hypothetical protein K9K38_22995 [Rhodoferax sp.]|nr:hypothetical protein [Rhodoferax sp.]
MVGNDSGQAIDVVKVFGAANVPTAISPSVTTVWSWSNPLGVWNFYTPSMTASDLSAYAATKG